MPNDCSGLVKISALNKDELKSFINKYFINDNNEFELDFNKIIKMPDSIINDSDNYNWCINNWGTKWNAYDYIFSISDVDKIDLNLSISFSTAWTPCINVIRKLQIDNPNIKINYFYYECGFEIAGELLSNGVNDVIEFNQDNKDFRDWTIENEFETKEFYQDYDNYNND